MRKIDLDTMDRRILDTVQADGRISNADLADRVGLSPSACHRRLRRLEEEGVVEGYVALLNGGVLGRGMSVFVSITLDRQQEQDLAAFEAKVRECPEVMECYLMAGDSDYLLRVLVQDGADYERLHTQMLTRLPGVARVRSSFTLRTVAKRTAIPTD
ncbi:Lrp/AsnC family transcriptional regulator [Rhodospirillum centenum]|uniref:Leucine-responsive regulatory protein n=1 Tax=Rhodospirillum centenum (strain ATCC 51521 / SW) TaxID=414684 RepID=B6IRV6_RHOCS|nr:Lrp/AsnC ligand binding domain-containing protein [Rhodospirillum centenum]ACI98192.1 leucine-responsive regulatory protein [Rhodospirillum centenum SW]